MPTYKLTYFDIRGLAEPCRLIFEYAGVAYEDNRLPLGLLTDDQKKELQLPWGQVPVLEVDGKVLGQSRTIAMYLAKKFNLLGSNEWEEVKCSEFMDAFQMDFCAKWSALFRMKDEEAKSALIKTLVEDDSPAFLKKVEQKLKENETGFLVGSSVTVVDIYAVHFITHFDKVFNVTLEKDFPEIEKHIKTVYDLPGIKEWVARRPNTLY